MSSLALPASVTFADVRAAVQGLATAPAAAGPWRVDATALRNFDSAAIALMLDLRRRALAAGATMSVQGAPATMVDLATLYGVADLLVFEPA